MTTLEVSASSPTTLLIGGEWRCATARFDVHDPATGRVVGQADDGTIEDARAAVDAAAVASADWRDLPSSARADLLRDAAATIRGDIDKLGAILTSECGKPLAESRAELLGTADAVDWAADQGRRADGRMVKISGGRRGLVFRQPVGITVAIAPWNFPASMFLRKVALALAAGCTVVAKPAEQTPLIARSLVSHLHDAGVPAGVLNLITTQDPGPVVAAMLEDERVAKLSFTGSTEVGLALLRRPDRRLKRVSLELGGHAPAIVCADADVELAVSSVVDSKFRNAGQSCIATNRLFLHQSIYEQFMARLVEHVSALRTGPGSDPTSDLGPLINDTALRKLEKQVADAVTAGACVRLGGGRLLDSPLDQGWFYAPTVLTDVPADTPIAREEIFGPVLPVFAFEDGEDVIGRANSTGYGLAAYLYGNDTAHLYRLAEELEFGVVGINDPFPLAPELPFGGMKNSGLGREGGLEGLDGFLETKAVAARG